MTPGALRRAIQRRPSGDTTQPAERCDLCSEAVPQQHRHVLDEPRGALLCACQACVLLFHRDAAGAGHYQLVPDQRTRLPELAADDLGVPVGLAFFVTDSDGTIHARYPSPMGPTHWQIEPETWRTAQQRCPPLRDMAPGTQALLINTARGAREHWIVPIDDCYRLVALVRQEWRGLSGGSRVWPAIDRFFADLARRPGSPLRTHHENRQEMEA